MERQIEEAHQEGSHQPAIRFHQDHDAGAGAGVVTGAARASRASPSVTIAMGPPSGFRESRGAPGRPRRDGCAASVNPPLTGL
jgi:hypothetical protein